MSEVIFLAFSKPLSSFGITVCAAQNKNNRVTIKLYITYNEFFKLKTFILVQTFYFLV